MNRYSPFLHICQEWESPLIIHGHTRFEVDKRIFTSRSNGMTILVRLDSSLSCGTWQLTLLTSCMTSRNLTASTLAVSHAGVVSVLHSEG